MYFYHRKLEYFLTVVRVDLSLWLSSEMDAAMSTKVNLCGHYF
jgi:hypothetical protein